MPIEQEPAVLRAYVLNCHGFDPEDYDAAFLLMTRNRTDPFRPTPAEFRKWLNEAHCTKPAYVLEQLMWHHYGYWAFSGTRPRWDERLNGPKPGRPGCRLTQRQQDRVWRKIFSFWQRSDGNWVHAKYPDGYSNCRSCRLKSETGYELLKMFNQDSSEPIDPLSQDCPVSRAVLQEFGVPMTQTEMDAQKADYEARAARWREVVIEEHLQWLADSQGTIPRAQAVVRHQPTKPARTHETVGEQADRVLADCFGESP